ncbi:MAG TPA: SDR family oxidoreductase [Burkholderiaceae bacterium]|nr:SDR family oxidoreductase [Burkholderiaceae bacterium]
MTIRFDLTGRVALVTGASSGLGERFAETLAGAGARIVLAARRIERLEQLRERLRGTGADAAVVPMDVTDVDAVRAAIGQAEAQAGPIDILVNNSGVSTTQRLTDVTPQDFDFVFDTNARGAFFVAQECARRMIERAKAEPARQARIVNIASMAGLKVLPQIGIYCMSKAAVVHMTRAMALEWGRYNINVNAICPGYIRTEINADHWETEAGRRLIQMLPRKRIGDPADLDGLLLLLVSEHSHFINGAAIAADDGFAL